MSTKPAIPRRGAAATSREATLRHGYQGRVTCGHCCSLAVQDAAPLRARSICVADAGIAIVTLPTVNMYLQDRTGGRTPRWRGVTVIHELRAAGVRVAVAGDNCRDPFYAYGDHDMLDTFRQACASLHLDHPFGDTPALAVPRNPRQPWASTTAFCVKKDRPASLSSTPGRSTRSYRVRTRTASWS